MESLSRLRSRQRIVALALLVVSLGGCATPSRKGDEFIVAGRPVRADTRVVTWEDAGGLDAYRTARVDEAGAAESFGARRASDGTAIAAGDFDALLGVVDQIVLHYDGVGSSRGCFEQLAERQLSAHFLIDVDGTVYQTLDLQERAYHATVANNRSIGIEIANLGAFPAGEAGSAPIARPEPAELAEGREGSAPRTVPRNHTGGSVHGIELVQQDFTPAQYAALAKLIDALCRTFTSIERRVPRDSAGVVVMSKLPDDALAEFHGVLGHFHIQENKVDPGPAFQWELIFPR